MNKAYPELAEALSEMLDKIDAVLKENGYQGEPVKMYLAGGMAVNFWCGSRYTADVDASFSKKLLPPKLTVDYLRPDGTKTYIYFDTNYNTAFALMHEDSEDDAVEWEGIGNEHRLVHLYVLSPVDLAVSKIARLLDHDKEDIMNLATCGLIESKSLRDRAQHALVAYVGNIAYAQIGIDEVCSAIEAQEQLRSM